MNWTVGQRFQDRFKSFSVLPSEVVQQDYTGRGGHVVIPSSCPTSLSLPYRNDSLRRPLSELPVRNLSGYDAASARSLPTVPYAALEGDVWMLAKIRCLFLLGGPQKILGSSGLDGWANARAHGAPAGSTQPDW